MIFDMDGTLIDTERLNLRFWMQAGENLGHPITEEEALHIRSLDGKLVRAYLEGNHPGMDFYEVREERRRLMREHVSSIGLDLKPGVVDILTYLRSNGIKTAVATASRPDHANEYLEMLGIHGMFDEIVCTSSVPNGKPAPDVYLFACGEIGERPEDCIAVEDAPNGVRSAYAAGCKVVFIPDLTPADPEIESMAWAFNDLNSLLEHLRSGRRDL